MASSSRPRHRYTYAQYAALERESSTKHEFFDGEIYAMVGGSEDLRIYVEAVGLATFPDGSAICGPLQQRSTTRTARRTARGSCGSRSQEGALPSSRSPQS